DTAAEVESTLGLRQVNATSGAFAAYRFNGPPVTLTLKLRRIEPDIIASERVWVTLEESRFISIHDLTLDVQREVLYGLDLAPSAGLTVSDVRGNAVQDWKVTQPRAEGKLHLNFNKRVLGEQKLEVVLEQLFKSFPETIAVGPLRVAGAAKESSQVGVSA